MHILVLYGGTSNERAVSLRSGQNVADHLQAAGHVVHLQDPSADNFSLAKAVVGVEAVVPMLHGAGGEDGTLQAELDALHVPYFGSGEQSCKQTFNKVLCKERLAENGIVTPNWEVVTEQQFIESDLRLQSYVLKPIVGGSSIDTLIVHNPAHQPAPDHLVKKLFKRYKRMLLEELIEGQELTVGVLGSSPLPVILIVPPAGEEFDYENKYNGRTQEIVNPKALPARIRQKAQALAMDIHVLMGCRHVSRTDMILTPSGALYVLETNTLPGMTSESLVPKAAAAAGMGMIDLAQACVEMATTA